MKSLGVEKEHAGTMPIKIRVLNFKNTPSRKSQWQEEKLQNNRHVNGGKKIRTAKMTEIKSTDRLRKIQNNRENPNDNSKDEYVTEARSTIP